MRMSSQGLLNHSRSVRHSIPTQRGGGQNVERGGGGGGGDGGGSGGSGGQKVE